MTKLKELDIEKYTKLTYENMCRGIGEYINYIRESRDISLRELYRRSNISIAVLSDIENGLKLPRIETLIKLALVLDIRLEVFFSTKFLPCQPFVTAHSQQLRENGTIRNALLNARFNKDEVKDIMNFIEFTKSKRNK